MTQNAVLQSKTRKVLPMQATKTCGRAAEVQFHSFLTSALDGDEWSASRRGRLTPGEEDTGQIYSEILKPCSLVSVYRRFEET
jgi:hypothetical protein